MTEESESLGREIVVVDETTVQVVEVAAQGPAGPPGLSARYFWFGAVLGPEVGEPDENVSHVGIDATVLVLPASVQGHGFVAQTAASSIGYTAAGKAAWVPLGVDGIALQAGDTLTPSVSGVLWQVGPDTNWCNFSLAHHDLTAADASYKYVEGDITIKHQSGDDFSVGVNDEGDPAILSAAGGQFLSSVYLEGELA